MSEINAIATNNYILHNIDAKKLYVQEPLFTANSGDAVYVGWRPDETVLYETTATGQPEALATWNLSDNPNNFEKLEITYVTYPEGPYGNKIGICPCNNDCYSLDNVYYNSVGKHYYWMFWQLSSTNNQMNLTSGGFRQIDSSSTAVSNQTTLRIYKIVGINRKENA